MASPPLRPAEDYIPSVLERATQARDGVATVYGHYLAGDSMAAIRRYRTATGKMYLSVFAASGGRMTDITAAVAHILGEPAIITATGALALSTDGMSAERLAQRVARAMDLPEGTIHFEAM